MLQDTSKLWWHYERLTFELDFILWILLIARYISDRPKIYVLIFFQGYRVISIDIPQVWNHLEWIHSFEKFLDSMNIHHVRKLGSLFL